MKRVISIVMLTTFTLLATGCSNDKSTVERKGLTGFVVEADYQKNRLLVVESDETKQGEDYEAEWYSLNKDAIILDNNSNPALFTDAEVGSKVETWSTSHSLESYPASTDLSKLIIADDVKHPDSPMLQKTAIQAAIIYIKNLTNRPGTIIIQNVSTNETEWIIQIYHYIYNEEKSYKLGIDATTGEVREIQ
ncbi:DUF3221 domain-containing protein [Brevibacillus sp. FSL L8-0710]|uniref:DUF3221 domain-containing protein n=1 Tax=Brevibacillus sp. FSL L8-0710 TaxID=2975313 RepID=UPI0030F836F9